MKGGGEGVENPPFPPLEKGVVKVVEKSPLPPFTKGGDSKVDVVEKSPLPPFRKGGDNKVKVVALDLDEAVMKKGLEFTKSWQQQITPLLESYANIDQI
jgi:hypothetical protein